MEDGAARFETHAQRAAREGLMGKAQADGSRPLTSAGYLTKDKGLLREQVYSR